MRGRQDTPRLAVPVGSRDHVQGLATAPVTFVEYGDYECPSCGAAYPIVKEVQRRLSARLRFVFRNFPLTTVHPHAQHAAEAAEAVGAQRRFWEMHDTLFEHHHALTDEALIGYAKALERIPGARFVELEGSDHMMWLGNVDALLGEIEEFLTGTRAAHPMDRVLASILLMDVEQSTEHLVHRGNAAWRDTLDQLHGIGHRQIATFRGSGVSMTGDQIMAPFEGPIRAIRCAEAIQRDAEVLGLRLRAGVHTGEVEQSGNDLRGIAVHVAARIAALAKGNEILVSATVRDLVAGSGLSFADRGEQRAERRSRSAAGLQRGAKILVAHHSPPACPNTVHRVRESVSAAARTFLVDFWTNAAHTAWASIRSDLPTTCASTATRRTYGKTWPAGSAAASTEHQPSLLTDGATMPRTILKP